MDAVHILVGLKRLDQAKTRLVPHVLPSARRELMLSMLATVVTAAREAALGPVWLATSEPSAGEIAAHLRVSVVADGGHPWNQGLIHALASILPAPASVLYLAGDLPLLKAAELRQFAAQSPRPGVGIARARDGGTNALLMTPSHAMPPGFGRARSADAHAADATARGLTHMVIDLPGLALDVDTVADAWDAGLVPRPVSETGREPVRG